MANLALAFDILARDKGASKTFDNVGKSAETAGKKATVSGKDFNTAFGLVGLGAIAAGASVVKFGADSIEAYKDAAKQHRVLEDAYKRFPAIADKSIKSMDDQAAALSKITKFDDDAISSTQGLLAQYKLTGTQIQQLIPLILDYAEKTGKDLPTAADTVGKALLGQGRALKEIGINFKDTGSTAGNFTELMGGLRKQVGGFAEQEGKSAEGRAAILANKFGNLQEAIGEKLLPAVEFTTDRLSDLVGAAGNLGNAIGGVPKPALAAAAALVAWQVAGDRIVAFASKGAAPIKAWSESIKLAGLYAKDAGGGLGGLKAGFQSLSGGLGVAKTAAKGMQSAGSALFDLMGGPWGVAIGGAAFALTHFWEEGQKVNAIADQLASTIDKTSGKFTDLSRKSVVESLLGDLSADDVNLLKTLGVNFGQAADLALKGGAAFDQYRASLVDQMNAQYQANGLFSAGGQALEGFIGSLGRVNDGAQRTAVVQGVVADSMKKTVDATQSVDEKSRDALRSIDLLTITQKTNAAAAQAQRDAQKELANVLLEVTDAAVGADEANIGYQDSIDQVSDSLKTNGRTLDINTAKGRANKQALIDSAKSAVDMAKANLTNGQSVDTVGAAMDRARQKFIEQAEKAGASKKAAEAMATQYGLTRGKVDELNTSIGQTPKQKETVMKVADAAALSAVAAVKAALAGIAPTKTVRINAVFSYTTNTAGSAAAAERMASLVPRRLGGPIPGYAGGTLIGPGTGTSDSILARVEQTGRFLRVSAGEFVSTDASRRRNEYALEAGNRGAALQVAPSAPTSSGDYVRLHRHDITLLAQEIAKYRLPAVVERRNLMSSFADGAS